MIHRLPYLLLIVLIIASCRTDTAPATGPYEPAPLSEVNFKNTDNHVRVGLITEPDNLNPLLTTASISRYVHEMIFQPLNGQNPEDLTPVPVLASLPDVSERSNGKVDYAYVLDDDATWPNGLPVTAADVVFSIKLLLNPLTGSGAYRAYLSMVENVVTSPNDERRFKVVIDQPYVLTQQAIGDVRIFPEYVYDPERVLRRIRLADLADDRTAERLADNNEELQQFSQEFNALASVRSPGSLVGSGPYELSEWASSEFITLNKRDDYWAAGAMDDWMSARPDQLTFKFIPDPNTMTNALRDELIDLAIGYPVEQFRALRDDPFLLDRYTFNTVQGTKYFGVLFNQRNPLFRSAATRRALAQLVNVDALIEQLFPGELATRVVGPVLPNRAYYNSALEPIAYDPAAAKAALAEAGWEDTNGDGTLDKELDGERTEFEFDFLIFPSSTSEAIGALIAQWAGQAGVKINVVTKDPRALYAELNNGNFASAIVGQAFSPSVDDFTQSWASTSTPPEGSNRGGFANREADRLLARIRETLGEDERYPLYQRFQEILYQDQPMIFLFSPRERLVISRRLEFSPRATTPNVLFNDLELATR